jgi:hypothetical protein
MPTTMLSHRTATISSQALVRVLLVMALSFWLAPAALFGQEVSRVAICDVFANIERWNGQMVEVQGIIEAWSGYWLAGRNCETRIRIGNVRYENLIALINPKGAEKISLHKVPYVWDLTSWNKFQEAIYYAGFYSERVRMTVVGLYETRTPRDALVNSRFPDQYFGFGDQGVAPAQILVREVKDIVREPDPAKQKLTPVK